MFMYLDRMGNNPKIVFNKLIQGCEKNIQTTFTKVAGTIKKQERSFRKNNLSFIFFSSICLYYKDEKT